MQRVHFRLKDRRGNPVGTFTAFGKSKKAATRKGRRMLKNIAAGFVGQDGEFRPSEPRRKAVRKRARANPKRKRNSRAKRARPRRARR
jgi:hypothetical protein